MEELRLTVVSDATQEFPNNRNNHFKVRLPRPLVLSEEPWAMSLWSLSVPDETVDQKVCQVCDYVVRVFDVVARLSNVQGGKYTVIEGTNNKWISHDMKINQVLETRPKTGVEFWQRVVQFIEEKTKEDLQTAFEKDTSKRVQQPLAFTPTFRWDGDDLILQANKITPYDVNTHGHPFAFDLQIARAFGFAQQDPITQAWSLGPNTVPSYPVYDQMPVAMADFTTYKPEGPTVFVPHKWSKWEWFRIAKKGDGWPNDQIEFTSAMEWRFTNLNRSFARLTNQLETVMVYTDAVQSNTVNHRQVPLLRSLHLHRSGRGRVTVEPKHREWIPLNGQTLELLEFQLATASGPLTDLSPGQTIVTVGLKPIKS